MIDELRKRVECYLSEKPQVRNPSKLAKDASLPYTTVRRIIQGEVSSVTIETAVSLLSVFAKKDEILDFVERNFPVSGKMIKRFNAPLPQEAFAKKELLEAIEDYGCWYAASLAERSCGVSIDELARSIGEQRANDAIEELDRHELIECKNGRYSLKDRDFSQSGNARSVLNELGHYISAYNERRRGEPGFMLANLTTGWSEEGLALVRETIKEAAINLMEASKNPKYSGDHACFIGMLSGRLD
jgi:hypothetical protein